MAIHVNVKGLQADLEATNRLIEIAKVATEWGQARRAERAARTAMISHQCQLAEDGDADYHGVPRCYQAAEPDTDPDTSEWCDQCRQRKTAWEKFRLARDARKTVQARLERMV